MSDPILDRPTLQKAFTLLAENLGRKNVVGEIHVFGGAAMVLAFSSREAARDVDAVFEPDTRVRDATRDVAKKLGLPESWLNNQAPVYVSGKSGVGPSVFDHPHLRVMASSPEHLLAMKVRAARAVRDSDDIQVLVTHLGISDTQTVFDLVERFFPGEPISQRSILLVEDLLSSKGVG